MSNQRTYTTMTFIILMLASPWYLWALLNPQDSDEREIRTEPPRRTTTPPQHDELGYKRLVSIEERCSYSYPQICK